LITTPPPPNKELLDFLQIWLPDLELIPGQNLFRILEGTQPIDPTTTLYPYGGEPPEMVQSQSNYPSITPSRVLIKVRDQNPIAAETLAWTLWGNLFLSNIWLGNSFYTKIQPMGEPGVTEPPDVNDRIAVSFNLMMRRRG
jgi:hypothetical protein